MKNSILRRSKSDVRASAHRSERRWQAALRAQRTGAPDLFSDGDEDDVEVASLLRDFESVHEEALESERYN